MVDTSNDAEGLLSPVQNILSQNCGPTGLAACIDYNDFSPVNLLAPVTIGLTTAANAVSQATQVLVVQQQLVDDQAAAVKQANNAIASLNKSVSDLQAQQIQLQQQVSSAVAQKADMIARGLDKIHLPGHMVTPTRSILGHRVPIGPPVFVPGGTSNNPNFDTLVNSITSQQNQVTDVLNKINQAQKQLQTAQQNLIDKTNALNALQPGLVRLQGVLTKANATLEVAKSALQFEQAVAQDLIPCADSLPGP
jgi:hypothetical protein